LLDRLELIEVPSYTELEKIKIAQGFLVKKQMAANGLKDGDVSFPEEGSRRSSSSTPAKPASASSSA
jgi:ATP-dependent Lon protease